MIRPEVTAALWRWREVIGAGGAALFGLWLMRLGGWVLVPVGAAVLSLAVGFALLAWRRLRFGQGVDAPGIVEVDEAEIGYFGPVTGGAVSLDELAELRLITMRGQRLWRLKQTDGQTLLIPVAAQGADRLFDAFAALPGMDSQALVAAVQTPVGIGAPGLRAVVTADDAPLIGPVIWRRNARAVLTRP